MRALVLVALLLVAAGIWLLVGGEMSPPRTLQSAASETEGATAPITSEGSGAQPAADRRSALVDGPIGEGEVLYNLRVVRGVNEMPVPGAQVHWLTRGFDGSVIPEAEREELRRDDAERARRYGESGTTDAGGRLSLRGPPDGLTLHGRDGDWYGRLRVMARDPRTREAVPPEPEYVLQLRLDQTLVVRTIDESGEPVPDVYVRLDTSVIADGESRAMPYGHGAEPTDAQGVARWRHVQTFVPQEHELESATITALLFGGASEPVSVDLRDVPEEPVEIVLPAFGSMEVVLLGPDGLPWRNPGETSVRIVSNAERGGRTFTTSAHNSIELGVDGRAIAMPVICGDQLYLRARAGGSIETIVDGPRLAGERVRAELRMPDDIPIVTGRIVDTEGQPVAGSFFMQFEFDGRGMTSSDLSTDDTGQFRAALADRYTGRTPSIKATRTFERASGSAPTAVRRMNSPLLIGNNEVGDLVLQPPPVLVAGRVEWTDGIPMRSPSFIIEHAVERTGPDDPQRWAHHTNLRSESREDGSFTVFEYARSSRYRLRLHERGFLPIEPVEFSPGTEDLVIRVEKGGAVEVTVIGDSPALLRTLSYRLVPFQGPPAGGGAVPGDGFAYEEVQGGRARCVWTGLESGPHRLTIGCPGTPPLLTLEIDVPRGQSADDPRLRDIDLRGRVREITVTLLDATGVPIAVSDNEAGVLIRGQEAPAAEWYGRTPKDGRVELTVPAPVDLIATAPGYRAAELSGVFSDTVVRLEQAPQLSVRLIGLPQLPADVTASLFVRAAREPGQRPRRIAIERGGYSSTLDLDRILGRRNQMILVEDGSDAVVDSRGGGAVSLNLALQLSTDSRRQAWPVEVRPATLDLDAYRADTVIDLTVDRESLQKALEEIGK